MIVELRGELRLEASGSPVSSADTAVDRVFGLDIFHVINIAHTSPSLTVSLENLLYTLRGAYAYAAYKLRLPGVPWSGKGTSWSHHAFHSRLNVHSAVRIPPHRRAGLHSEVPLWCHCGGLQALRFR